MIYEIRAHRWGRADTHTYLVGYTTYKHRACEIAKSEAEERGGKYGVVVTEYKDMVSSNDDNSGVVIHYECSRYGELELRPADPDKDVEDVLVRHMLSKLLDGSYTVEGARRAWDKLTTVYGDDE